MPKKLPKKSAKSGKSLKSKSAKKPKTSKKGAKVIVPAKAERLTQSQIDELIKKGRQRGFMTETELLYAFPELEEQLDQYEELLDEFEKNGIAVVETGG